jgi:hypothetical protein
LAYILKCSGFTNYLSYPQIKKIILMGRFQHQGGVCASSRASDGYDITAGEGTSIGRHHRNFYGHLGSLAEEPERIGD